MKKTERNLILCNMLFCVGLLMSNLVGGKLISVFGMTVAGAIATYPLTFLMTDVIGELWGKKEANECVKTGVICQLVFLLLAFISVKIPPVEISRDMQEAVIIVLFQSFRMTAASLGAFLCSQFLDVFLFHTLKKHCANKKWLRNNLSTMTSQLIDTAVFITIAFYGVVQNIWLMVISQYIIKFFLALLDTPFFYFLTRSSNSVKAE